MMKKLKYYFRGILSIAAFLSLVSCGNDTPVKQSGSIQEKEQSTTAIETEEPIEPKASLGVGSIKSITLKAIDDGLAAKGKEKFEAMCTACHKIDVRHIGPALKGVTSRRTPEWIMNMILDPEKMVKEDETAKALLGEYIAPMANQHLTEEEARSVLEYFRQYDKLNP